MKRKRIILSMLAIALSAAFLKSTFAYADNPYAISTKTWSIELGELEPGQVVEGEINIANVGENEFQYDLEVLPLTSVNQGGSYSYSDETSHTMLKDWIALETYSGNLNSDETAYIHYVVTIPYDVPAGGQYAAVRATAKPTAQSDKEIGMQGLPAVAIIFRSSVAGETRSTAEILENDIPGFMLSAPLKTSSLVKNTGNIHDEASYILQVFPLFSDEELYTNEENPETHIVMPDSDYFDVLTWENTPSIGVFNVRQTVKIFDEISVNEKIVIICPFWLICIAVFGIIAVALWLISKAKARK